MPALSLGTMWLRQRFVNSMSVVDSVEKVELDSDLERQKFERPTWYLMLAVDSVEKLELDSDLKQVLHVVIEKVSVVVLKDLKYFDLFSRKTN